MHRENMAGGDRIRLQFLPEPGDMDINGAGRGILVISPDLIHEFVSGYDFSLVLCEQLHHRILPWSQFKHLSTFFGLEIREIKNTVAEAQLVRLGRFLFLPPEQGLDAR